MKRLFFLVAFLALLAVWPGPARAQGPVPVEGVLVGTFQDQDPLTGDPVTRTVTLTVSLVFTPVQQVVLVSPYAYTATLDSGNDFALERSVTYGDVISGAGALLVFALFLFAYGVQLIERYLRGRTAQ